MKDRLTRREFFSLAGALAISALSPRRNVQAEVKTATTKVTRVAHEYLATSGELTISQPETISYSSMQTQVREGRVIGTKENVIVATFHSEDEEVRQTLQEMYPEVTVGLATTGYAKGYDYQNPNALPVTSLISLDEIPSLTAKVAVVNSADLPEHFRYPRPIEMKSISTDSFWVIAADRLSAASFEVASTEDPIVLTVFTQRLNRFGSEGSTVEGGRVAMVKQDSWGNRVIEPMYIVREQDENNLPLQSLLVSSGGDRGLLANMIYDPASGTVYFEVNSIKVDSQSIVISEPRVITETDSVVQFVDPSLKFNPETNEYIFVYTKVYQETGNPLLQRTIVMCRLSLEGEMLGNPMALIEDEGIFGQSNIDIDSEGCLNVGWFERDDSGERLMVSKFTPEGQVLTEPVLMHSLPNENGILSLTYRKAVIQSLGEAGILFMTTYSTVGVHENTSGVGVALHTDSELGNRVELGQKEWFPLGSGDLSALNQVAGFQAGGQVYVASTSFAADTAGVSDRAIAQIKVTVPHNKYFLPLILR